MKRLRLHAILSLLTALTATAAGAQPSRAFIQEVGHVAPAGAIYVDLLNSTGTHTRRGESQLRLATRTGEFLASVNDLGFKTLARRNTAAYFNLGLVSSSDLNAKAGAAWTLASPAMLVNLNPEFAKTADGNKIYLNGALFLPLRVPLNWGKVLIGGEVSLSDAAANTGLAAGLRWLPKARITLDIILAGDGGSADGAIATPAALRVNLRL